MTPPAEVIVLDPWRWFPQIERVAELSEILESDPPSTIADTLTPGAGHDPGTSLIVADPAFWGSHFELLFDGLYRATLPEGHPALISAEAPPDEILLTEPDGPWTMTVEQAAEVLGISRALAYESVKRGEIPSLRLGRRIVVPIQALRRLVDSAGEQSSDRDDDSR